MSVYVANESGVEVDEVGLAALSRHVLGAMGVTPLAELSLSLVDIDHMERLHVQYMNEPGPTDVLAFAQDDLSTGAPLSGGDEVPEALLGDVVLCPEFARPQARERGHSLEHELHVLCVHGVLHLLGYDHSDPDEEREMFEVQGRLLESWQGVRAETVEPDSVESDAGGVGSGEPGPAGPASPASPASPAEPAEGG